MSWFYRTFIRPVLFAQDAEAIHGQMLHGLGWAGRHEIVCDALESFYGAAPMPVETLGLRFPNPIGLAAGMDKRAAAVPAWAAMGFGHVELGTVTWQAQPGNPLPRLFRVIPDEAVVNRMGFNNDGATALGEALKHWRTLKRWPQTPVGISLGKSKVTPLDHAAADYANSFRALREHADFFAVNVSSPNTPNLRQLQDKTALEQILTAMQAVQSGAPSGGPATVASASWSDHGNSGGKSTEGTLSAPIPARPILVKIAPDLTFEAVDEVLALIEKCHIAGIIATNTTISRPETTDADVQRLYAETGGLSGKPLRARSTEVIRHIYRQTQGKVPIIGVGGIFTADDAWDKITAGATLLQVYTGLVFEGPGAVKDIVTGLQDRLQKAGMKSISEAVGTGH